MILFLSVLAQPAFAASSADPLKIQSVIYNAKEQTVSLVGQREGKYHGEYQMVRLTSPERMVIDIPNAYLSTPTRSVPIHQSGIDRMELSQSLGAFYQVVRITVYGQSAEALNAIQIKSKDNTFYLALASQPDVQSQANAPLPSTSKQFSFLNNPASQPQAAVPDKNVVQSAQYQNGILTLTAQKGQVLAVKNQFTLSGPSRLVVDLANTVLAEKSMTAPIDVKDNAIRSIRLGQFDENTVRIVVETSQPNGMYLVYPGEDKSQIALSANMVQSIRTLPSENQNVGFVHDINLSKRHEASIVKIHTTEPMVRRLSRRGDQIEVELLNIAAKPSFIAYDKREYVEIKEIRLSPLSAEEPNTKLIIKLDQPGVDMDSHMSLDGKTLEVTLTPRYSKYARGGRMPTLVTPNGIQDRLNGTLPALPTLRKGAYTVVVDAGHGGKDKGANREGILEKNLNLEVALKLKRALEAKGITVHMTRSTDMFLELSQITGITNRINPDAFVSVHTNASVNPAANGIETYYFTPQSRDLATRVHRRLVNSIASPDRGVRTARFYVVHHTRVPAILCEMGYISNPAERAALQTEARQNATAEAIAQGVVEFLGRSLKAELPPEEELLPLPSTP